MAEPRNARRNENQLCPDKIGESPSAREIGKCHFVQWADVARRQGKVFNDSIQCLELLYEPCLLAELRPRKESTPARTDSVLVLLKFDSAYIVLPAPRIPVHALTVSSRGSLITLKKQLEVPVLRTDPDVLGTLSLLFRYKTAVHELALSLATASPCFLVNTLKLLRSRDARGGYQRHFCFLEGDLLFVFYH